MSNTAPTFEITTRLSAPASEVWDAAVTPEGINYELAPFLKMTTPEGIDDGKTLDDFESGDSPGRSWLLAGRLVSVEFDDLHLEEIGPGLRFRERSKMATAREWTHEREVSEVDDDTCEVTDSLTICLRKPLNLIGGRFVAPCLIKALFAHRHRRLAKRWGEPA